LKVLFTTPILEHPATGGPTLRIENSIKALSFCTDLYIISRSSEHTIGGKKAIDFFKSYCKSFCFAPSVKKLNKNRFFNKFLKLILLTILKLDDAHFIVNFCKHENIKIIWFGYGNISFPLIYKIKKIDPALKLVCDTDSVWSQFILREIPFQTDHKLRSIIYKKGKEKEAEEKLSVDLCDITTAVSDVDSKYYQEISKNPAKIHIFSNVIDLKTYSKDQIPPANLKKPCIYLAGTFGRVNSPMDMAANWILEFVFPKLIKQIPGIHFYIVGKGTELTLNSLSDPNVTVTGKLTTVLPYLCNADIAIVPLKFESGTRFKILEAGACGIPIVSTTLGAEGLPVQHGRHLLIADEPDAFADAIVMLIRDKYYANILSQNCKKLISDKFSIEALTLEAKSILACLSITD
jgi:polysaccharide biosynthesis protein PslH